MRQSCTWKIIKSRLTVFKASPLYTTPSTTQPFYSELCQFDFTVHMLRALSLLEVTLREMQGTELGLRLRNAGLSTEAAGDYILKGEGQEENQSEL